MNPSFQFSGKVEERNKGITQQTRYFVKGQQTARTIRTPTGERKVAEVKKPSRFRFERKKKVKEIEFKKSGKAQVTTYIKNPSSIQTGISSEALSKIINPRPLVVSVAPDWKERFSQRVKGRGYVSSILSTPFEEAGRSWRIKQYEKLSKNPKKRLYQTEAIEKGIGVLPKDALYFSPIGFDIIIAESVESLGTKAGRERLNIQSKILQQKGLSKTTSNIISYGEPIVSMAIGGYGVRTQYKNIGIASELKQFEKTPTNIGGFRFEGEKGGIDILKGYKDVKGARYYTQIEQPFYKVGNKKVILEEGKAITTRFKNNKFQTSFSETYGRSKTFDIYPRKTKNINFLKISRELNAESSISRIISKEYATAKGKISSGIKFPSGEEGGKILVKGKIKIPEIESNIFLSSSKEKGNIIFSISGEAKKLGFDTRTGIYTLKGKPTQRAVIIKNNLPSFDETKLIGSYDGGKKSSDKYFRQLYQENLKGYETPLVEKSLSKVKPSKIKPIHSENLKLVLGLQEPQQSKYYGKGLYERTEEFGSFKIGRAHV